MKSLFKRQPPEKASYPLLWTQVGNTPLLLLKGLSEQTGCVILGKAEHLNPGGSCKDRTAIGILEDAEARGVLVPGMTLVEASAGNTGIALAMYARIRGYTTVIVIPEKQSPEKTAMLKVLGAQVIEVRERPPEHPEHYVNHARHLAEHNGWFYANQFDNIANRLVHERTTGQEILEQTEGRISAFVAAAGTGGTLAGVARALKKAKSNIAIACADPEGSSLYSYYTHGKLEAGPGQSRAQGIGQSRITQNLAGAPVDKAYRVTDSFAFSILKYLAETEGLFLGPSSGVNVGAAVLRALEYGPGQTIVTLLCDSGTKYLSMLDAYAHPETNPNLEINLQ